MSSHSHQCQYRSRLGRLRFNGWLGLRFGWRFGRRFGFRFGMRFGLRFGLRFGWHWRSGRQFVEPLHGAQLLRQVVQLRLAVVERVDESDRHETAVRRRIGRLLSVRFRLGLGFGRRRVDGGGCGFGGGFVSRRWRRRCRCGFGAGQDRVRQWIPWRGLQIRRLQTVHCRLRFDGNPGLLLSGNDMKNIHQSLAVTFPQSFWEKKTLKSTRNYQIKKIKSKWFVFGDVLLSSTS